MIPNGTGKYGCSDTTTRKRYAMPKERGNLVEWVRSLPDNCLVPNDALVRYMREHCSGKGTRVNLDTLGTVLPNITSFIRVIFAEKAARAVVKKKPARKVKEPTLTPLPEEGLL